LSEDPLSVGWESLWAVGQPLEDGRGHWRHSVQEAGQQHVEVVPVDGKYARLKKRIWIFRLEHFSLALGIAQQKLLYHKILSLKSNTTQLLKMLPS
jgi:hypothetical protein